MKVVFHPEFPDDQLRFEARYTEIAEGLARRFRGEINEAIESIKGAPGAAGHFVNTGSKVVPEFRRRNLPGFPFFILYGWTGEWLIFGAIIPTRSDPLTWLTRFSKSPG
jgi:hypothetical protein